MSPSALAWVLLSVVAGSTQVQAPAPDPSRENAARLERWREALELDRAGEVLTEGEALVAQGSALEYDGEAIALVARALTLRGQEARAMTLLDRARPREPSRGFVVLESARILIDRDELDQAIAVLSDLAGAVRHPELAESYLLLGRAKARLGELAQAAPLLKKFVELAPLSPETPAAWHMLAQEAIARRDLGAARAFGERAERLGQWQAYYRARRLQIRDKPKEPLPRLGLAQLWLEIDQPARAREVLRELVTLAPEFSQGWFLLGEAERRLGELAEAEKSYSRALECDPGQALARNNRAVIARQAGRDAAARADFEILVAGKTGEDPRLLGAHLELARILLRAGEPSAAQARYERYRELGGKDPLEPPASGR